MDLEVSAIAGELDHLSDPPPAVCERKKLTGLEHFRRSEAFLNDSIVDDDAVDEGRHALVTLAGRQLGRNTFFDSGYSRPQGFPELLDLRLAAEQEDVDSGTADADVVAPRTAVERVDSRSSEQAVVAAKPGDRV